MLKEQIIFQGLDLSFSNELNNTTNSTYEINSPSQHAIILSDKNKIFHKKEAEFQPTLLSKKVKFQVLQENTNKFLVIKYNKKSKLSKRNGLNIGPWTKKEKIKFIEGIYRFGSDWRAIKKFIGSRLSEQVRSHGQKFFLKMKMFKDPSLGIDFTKNSNIDKKEIIRALRDIINNSKDENIIEIIYKKFEKVRMKKDVFKNENIKSNDKLNIINNFNKEINSNFEKISIKLEKDDNSSDSEKSNENKFELKDKSESNEIINLYDFYDANNGMEYDEIFCKDIYNDFSYFSKDNNYIIDKYIDMDINNSDYFC